MPSCVGNRSHTKYGDSDNDNGVYLQTNTVKRYSVLASNTLTLFIN